MSFMPDYLDGKSRPGTKLPPKIFDPLDGELDLPSEEDLDNPKSEWTLKVLKPKHRQIASLLAQGCGRDEVAKLCGCTARHITILTKQPLFKTYLDEMRQTAEDMLQAQFVGSVEAIGDALRFGDVEERLKAARLQMEATGRIGNRANPYKESDSTVDRVARLAHRLVDLLESSQPPQTVRIINEEAIPLETPEHELRGSCERAQADGDGHALSRSSAVG